MCIVSNLKFEVDFIYLMCLVDFQKLVSVSPDFVNCILGSIRKMPYNIRFLARELLAALKVFAPMI